MRYHMVSLKVHHSLKQKDAFFPAVYNLLNVVKAIVATNLLYYWGVK